MTDNYFCKLYVDICSDRASLIKSVAALVGGAPDRTGVSCPWAYLDVTRNDDYGGGKKDDSEEGFLFYPFLVEADKEDGVDEERFVASLKLLVNWLKERGRVVASCDFEERLTDD